MIIDNTNKKVYHDLPNRGNGSTAQVKLGGDLTDKYYPTATFTHPFLDSLTINLDPSNKIPDNWTSTVNQTTGQLDITAPDNSVALSMYVDEYQRLEYGVLLNVRPPNAKKSYTFIITDNGQYKYEKQEDYTVTQPGGTTSLFDFYHDGNPVMCYTTPSGSIHILDMCGGYAVYHITKAHNQYQTGKLLNIPKPLFYAGWNPATKTGSSSAFGSINIVRIDANNVSVTVSEPVNNWIRNAALPIFIDPTLGYTTIGASSDVGAANESYVGRTPAMTEAGTLDSISHAFFTYSTVDCKQTIYDESGSAPNNQVRSPIVNTVNTGSTTWYTATCAGESLSNGARYWVGFTHYSSGGYPYRYWDTDASFTSYINTVGSYATPPNPFGGSTAGTNRRQSAYLTYTASGGSTATLTPSDGSISISGVTPTKDAIIDRTVTTGSISESGVLPGLEITISISTGSVSESGVLPGLEIEFLASTGSISEAGVVPYLDKIVDILSSVGSITEGGELATVTAITGSTTTITPNEGVINEAGEVAYLDKIVDILSTTGSISEGGSVPTIVQEYLTTLSPGSGSISEGGEVATISSGNTQIITPSDGSISISGVQGSVTYEIVISISPDIGSISVSGVSPQSVGSGDVVDLYPGVGIITIIGYTPVVDNRVWIQIERPADAWSRASSGSDMWTPVSSTGSTWTRT